MHALSTEHDLGNRPPHADAEVDLELPAGTLQRLTELHRRHGNVFRDVWHRWHVSWNGLTGTWGRAFVSAICVTALGWVATRRPRSRLVDAFLIGIVVSLVANDTPQDVLFWGAITGVGLRRSV